MAGGGGVPLSAFPPTSSFLPGQTWADQELKKYIEISSWSFVPDPFSSSEALNSIKEMEE